MDSQSHVYKKVKALFVRIKPKSKVRVNIKDVEKAFKDAHEADREKYSNEFKEMERNQSLSILLTRREVHDDVISSVNNINTFMLEQIKNVKGWARDSGFSQFNNKWLVNTEEDITNAINEAMKKLERNMDEIVKDGSSVESPIYLKVSDWLVIDGLYRECYEILSKSICNHTLVLSNTLEVESSLTNKSDIIAVNKDKYREIEESEIEESSLALSSILENEVFEEKINEDTKIDKILDTALTRAEYLFNWAMKEAEHQYYRSLACGISEDVAVKKREIAEDAIKDMHRNVVDSLNNTREPQKGKLRTLIEGKEIEGTANNCLWLLCNQTNAAVAAVEEQLKEGDMQLTMAEVNMSLEIARRKVVNYPENKDVANDNCVNMKGFFNRESRGERE